MHFRGKINPISKTLLSITLITQPLMEKTKTNESTSKRNLPTEPRLLSESAEQQELAETMQELIKTIKELAETLKVLEQHEYLELHRSKWKLVAYNILL